MRHPNDLVEHRRHCPQTMPCVPFSSSFSSSHLTFVLLSTLLFSVQSQLQLQPNQLRFRSSSPPILVRQPIAPSANPVPFQSNSSIIRVPLNRVKDIILPTLAPSDRFMLRIAPAVPTPNPSPSSAPGSAADPQPVTLSTPAARPETTIIIDLISPRQHRLILTAAGETPVPCPLSSINNVNSAPLPFYCSSPQTDTQAYLTRSSRAFVHVSGLLAETPVIVSVSNVDVISLSEVKLQFSRIVYQSDNPTALCPGYALDQLCSNQGICNRNSSTCECPPDYGDRACHIPIQTIKPPDPRPLWSGRITPLENSTLLNVTLEGRVARIRPAGPLSKVYVRARILIGAVEFGGTVVPIDGGDAMLSMICKVRGSNEVSNDESSPGTDVPTFNDDLARAEVVKNPLADGSALFDMLCVSKSDVGTGDDWLVAFLAQTLVANTTVALTSVVSVQVVRCGNRDLPDCPLGVGSRTVSLAAWVGIGVGVVFGVVALVALIFWACRTTIKGLPGNSQNGGILDGRLHQVVDYGKDPSVRHVPVDKIRAVSPRTVVKKSNTQEERAYPRVVIKRRSQDAQHQPRMADWDTTWQLERERRRAQLGEDPSYHQSDGVDVTPYRVGTSPREHRNELDIRELQELRDLRELQELRELRELRNQRGLHGQSDRTAIQDQLDYRNQREQRTQRDLDRELREQREIRDQIELREFRERREHQEPREPREHREARVPHESRGRRESQEALQPREQQQRDRRDQRVSRDRRPRSSSSELTGDEQDVTTVNMEVR